MPLIRRGPGLLRTAAVVGTATAVQGRVAHRQEQRFARQEQEAYQQQQPPPPPAPAAPVGNPEDPVAQIERLAQLQQQGMLTAEEFVAMKAKILGA
jgi:hypothetical protein